MKGRKRVACFFTAGYTELNAMKSFLGKINNKVEYIQLCPIGPRKSSVPVMFFYAAPEIEAWFLADWKNGFGSVYKGIYSIGQNDFFSIRFRKYVNESILTDLYKDCIEGYGYFGGKYRKLSGEIQSALQEIDFLEDYKPGKEHPMISYSKNRQGGPMLENIEPEVVLQNCPFFFKEGYQGLKAL